MEKQIELFYGMDAYMKVKETEYANKNSLGIN